MAGYLKVTYLKARYTLQGATVLEHETAVVASKDRTLEQIIRDGFEVLMRFDHPVWIAPAAVLSVEDCNERGYTAFDAGRIAEQNKATRSRGTR